MYKEMQDLPLKEIRKLHLEKDDVVLIEEDPEHKMPRVEAVNFYTRLKKECFPNNKLIILPSALKLKVTPRQQVFEMIDKLKEVLENEEV